MRFFPSLTAALLTSALISVAPARADGPENALFVEMVQHWDQAQDNQDDPAARLEALRAAQAGIDELLSDYAETDLAVAVVLDRSELPFTRATLRAAIDSAEATLATQEAEGTANALLVRGVQAAEQGAALPATDRDGALMRYALLREAQALSARLQEDYAETRAARDARRNRALRDLDAETERAAAQTAEICDGRNPQDCLMQEVLEIVGRDDFNRISVALSIAEGGQLVLAGEVLGRLYPTAQDAYAEGNMLKQLAAIYAVTDQSDTAKEIAGAIGNVSIRVAALAEISSASAAAGRSDDAMRQFAEAERLVGAIEHDGSRVRTLSRIAVAYAEAGRSDDAMRQFAEAERLAETIEDEFYRASALSAVARAYAKAGRFAEAERLVGAIEDDYYRAPALSAVARAYAEAGRSEDATRQFAEAERLAGTIDDASARATALRSVARASAKAGRFAEAKRLVEAIESDVNRAFTLGDIARQMAAQGRLAQAMEIARGIEDPSPRAAALAAIAARF